MKRVSTVEDESCYSSFLISVLNKGCCTEHNNEDRHECMPTWSVNSCITMLSQRYLPEISKEERVAVEH